MGPARLAEIRGKGRDRYRRGVTAKDAGWFADRIQLPVGLGLDRLVLEHRLGDEVAIGEGIERDGGGDAGERERLLVVLIGAALDAAIEGAAEPLQRRR